MALRGRRGSLVEGSSSTSSASCHYCWSRRRHRGPETDKRNSEYDSNASCQYCRFRKRNRGTDTENKVTESEGYASCQYCKPKKQHRGQETDNDGDDLARHQPPPTWLYLTVWLASVLVYLNGLTGDFVHDDISAIKSNPDVLGTNPVSRVFLDDYWGKAMSDPRSHKSYRPLTILTFRWSYSIFGLRPMGYHLTNVLLHSCVCLLLTRTLLRLLHLPQGMVLAAGLIFATHPVHTEAVTGLVGRADVMASICFLAALLSYHSAIERDKEDPGEETCIDEEGVWGPELVYEGGKRPFGCASEGGRHALGVPEGGGGPTTITSSNYPYDYNANRRDTTTEKHYSSGSCRGGGNTGGGGGECGQDKGWKYLRRAGVLSGLGTLCKEHALTALLVCAAWDIILHRKHIWRLISRRSWNETKRMKALVRRLMWLAVMSVGILTARVWMLRGSSPAFSDQDNPAAFNPSILTRTLTLWYLPAFNVWLLLCPWSLAHDWQMGSVPLITSTTDTRNFASLALYTVLALLVRAGWITKGREGSALLLGLAMMVLPFLPASNLLFTVGFVVAERVLYISSLGSAVVVAVTLWRSGRWRAPGLLLIILLFSARTLRRNSDWQSRETLFLAGLQTLPHNAKMHYNFANLQRDSDNPELATQHYQEAIRLWPGYSSAHNNLGTLLSDPSQAEEHFRLALKAHPQHAHAYYNLANLSKQQGRIGEAMVLLEESLRHDATNRDAVSVLAGLYGDDGRLTDAEQLHLTLLAARPSDPAVHNNYAAFLRKIGRREAALVQYKEALVLDPRHPVALVNTAAIMTSLHHNTQAETLYKRALAISWEAEVGESLGRLYLNTGRLAEAEVAFSTVLVFHPHHLSSTVCLARVRLQQRSYSESEDLLMSVLARSPHHQEALFQLSLLYTHTNRTHTALTLAQRAAHNCSTPPTLCARLHAHHGDLLNDGRNTIEAEQSYQVAVELEPTLTHAHVNLGALYHTKGDYVRAWRHYLTAHGQEPTNTLLLENMEKLRRAQHLHPVTVLPHCFNMAASSQHHHQP